MNTEDSEFERIEREQAMRGAPDAIHHTDTSETMEYIQGWNDCRQAMLEQSDHQDMIGEAQDRLIAEQAAQPYKGIADHTNQVTNGRMRIDPVTGDVGIGTSSSPPMHPEIKKMYEDYFDKCFRESSEPVPKNFMDALKFDVAMREWVGLTDEEVMKIAFNFDVPSLVVRTVEAKLKEKNT